MKAFLLDDSVNRNFWHIPTNAMKKYASSFIGRPWIIHPSGDHPQYIKEGVVHNSPTFIDDVLNVQDRYKGGDIVDITYEPLKDNPSRSGWFATIRVTNPEALQRLRSGSIPPWVSPQVYDLSKANPGEPTTEFIPLHIATVNEPAYGNIARVTGVCNGTGPSCIKALKSAALEVVNAIDNNNLGNSSFFQNSSNNTNRLTNPTTINYNPEQPVIAQNGYNPYQVQYTPNTSAGHQYVDQNGQQFISEKKQVQEVDANGNLITRTEDKKPRQQAAKQQTQQPQIIANPEQQSQQNQPEQLAPQTAPNSTVATQVPVAHPNSTPQVPNELLEAIKGLQASYQGVSERLNQIENFKKSAEDEKIKAASEAQRKIIESVFTPNVVADENARQDIINYFVGLPLADDDLTKILDMIVTGKFSTGGQDNNQAPPQKRQAPPSGGLKQASINRLVMSQVADNYRGNHPISMSKRFFSDIDADNL